MCALGVIKEYHEDLSPGMPLVDKNEKESLSLFHQSSQSSLETNIHRLASIFPASTEAEMLHIQ